MASKEKYLRHLTPVVITEWETHIVGDLVEVCNDRELPADFRDDIRGDLLVIKEDLQRFKIELEKEEW
jgi:hypothetical protein